MASPISVDVLLWTVPKMLHGFLSVQRATEILNTIKYPLV